MSKIKVPSAVASTMDCPPDAIVDNGDRQIVDRSFRKRAKAATLGLWPATSTSSATDRAGIAVRGGVWTLFGYIATQLLRTTATLVLARRFLGPEPFGVVGLV